LDRWKSDPTNGVTWWSDNAESVYQEAFTDLDRAIKAFLASRSGKRRRLRTWACWPAVAGSSRET
jgi:hypothetical protein